MIRIGEKITIEFLSGDPLEYTEWVQELPFIASVSTQNHNLLITTERGHNGLSSILSAVHDKGIQVGRVYCELPTLNDVFLEITGKELRD